MDDGARSDKGVFADGDPADDNGSGAEGRAAPHGGWQQRLAVPFDMCTWAKVIGEHHTGPEKDVVFDGHSLEEEDLVLDGHAVADGGSALDEGAVANVAITPDDSPRQDVGEGPDPSARSNVVAFTQAVRME